uniref:G-protein coupled receptors family 1 profile domain-containing protein n=1 Tax=Parascaris univalens TaxID=6257 RepID=A0A915C0K0_PARUN
MRNPFVIEMKAVCRIRHHLVFSYSPFYAAVQAFGAIWIFLVNNEVDISAGIRMKRSELSSFDQNRFFDLFLCVVRRSSC